METQIKELTIDEEKLIGASKAMIDILLGEPESASPEERTYILEQYCSGLSKKRLYLYFIDGKVTDYYVGII